MRYIYKYDEAAKKHLSKLLKKKLPDAQPWLHVGVKTMSSRNPYCAIAIWIWDTREVIYEHRCNGALLTNDKFHIAETGMHRAIDNRQELVGGRPDINEWMELGPEFDASHGSAFNGAGRVKHTALSKRRAKKAGLESINKYDRFEILEHLTGFDATGVDLQIAPEIAAKLVPMLKSAYAEEINAWYQYYIIAPFLVGKELTDIVADYAENGDEELKHASMLLERIKQLGGDFTDIESLDKLDAIARAKYIKPTSTDVAVSLQQVADAEKGAIETYTALEEATRNVDAITNELAKQILEDEQKHLQEALDFLADVK